MRLYLLRHAIAAPRDPHLYPDDVDRPLTPQGMARMAEAARGMKRLGLGLDLILTSPLARARQTARLAARAQGRGSPVRVYRPLAPGGSTSDILAGLPSSRRVGSVLLVGHEPDLSRLTSELILPAGASMSIEFKKGALCRIDFDEQPRPGHGTLVFMLPPRILRAIAGR